MYDVDFHMPFKPDEYYWGQPLGMPLILFQAELQHTTLQVFEWLKLVSDN